MDQCRGGVDGSTRRWVGKHVANYELRTVMVLGLLKVCSLPSLRGTSYASGTLLKSSEFTVPVNQHDMQARVWVSRGLDALHTHMQETSRGSGHLQRTAHHHGDVHGRDHVFCDVLQECNQRPGRACVSE